MQVTEATEDGLKRTLKVVIDKGELGQKFEDRIGVLKEQAHLKGFRPGKVPVSHLKKVFGRSVMAEVVNEAVEETTKKALGDRNERPAFRPNIAFTEDKDELERIIAGGSDLAFTMSFEVLPKVELADLKSVELERLIADVADESVDRALDMLRDRNTSYEVEADRVAETGDRLTLDFVGRIGGEAFEGGSAEGAFVVIGQDGFIPGFEEGLKGAKAGEERLVKATFPEGYAAKNLAGKEAVFETRIKEVAKPKRPELDEAFAKSLGADNVAQLREMVTVEIRKEHDQMSRARLKRALLDDLDRKHNFPLPPTLVDNEFQGVWQELQESLKRSGKSLADEGKTEEGAQAEYRKLAERRVRLGLVLAEIGERNDIKVTDEEMRAAVSEQARRYPGQERMVLDYYRKNPSAILELRAPLFEDKVISYALEHARVSERKVARDELFKSDEAPAPA